MKTQNYIAVAVLVVLVGAGGFFAGMKYQEGKRMQDRFGNFQRQGGGFSQRQGLRPFSGEIISVDDKSITVKLQDGSSKIVFFDRYSTN